MMMRKGLRAGFVGRLVLEGLESRVMMAGDLPGVVVSQVAVGNGSAVFVTTEAGVETRLSVAFSHGAGDSWNIGMTKRNLATGEVLMNEKGVSPVVAAAWPLGTASLGTDGRSMHVAGTVVLTGTATVQVGLNLTWTLDAGSMDTEAWNLGVSAQDRTLGKTDYHRGGATVTGSVGVAGVTLFSGSLGGQGFNYFGSQLNRLGAEDDVRSWVDWMTPPADAPRGALVHARLTQEASAGLGAGGADAGALDVLVQDDYFTNPASAAQVMVEAQTGAGWVMGNVGGLVGIAGDLSGATLQSGAVLGGTAVSADAMWRAIGGSLQAGWSRMVTTTPDMVTTTYGSTMGYAAAVTGQVQVGGETLSVGIGALRRSIEVSVACAKGKAEVTGAPVVGAREWRGWVLQWFDGSATAAGDWLKGAKSPALKYAYQLAVVPVVK